MIAAAADVRSFVPIEAETGQIVDLGPVVFGPNGRGVEVLESQQKP